MTDGIKGLDVFTINDIACELIDEIARRVQDRMGVKTGDFASHYFSEPERLMEIAQIVGEYAEAEWKHAQ